MQEQKISYLSQLYTPTLKESPVEAELASHKLLLRAAMIRKSASGIYSFLPLGMRVLLKVQNIVREEMNKTGSQEILMPALQPAEIWHESGRWDDYGPELMRLTDRHGHEFCLGPTHEEITTTLMKNELRSYKDLPTAFYQIQVKFRDEIRPRFGLLRGREFIMKDCYSFHANQASLDDFYTQMSVAYGRMCERSGLDYRAVEADSGQIGGKVSTEFMALAQAGEAEIVYCESSSCGYSANVEAAEANIAVLDYGAREIEKIHTPGVASIADLANFLDISESATVKAILGKTEEGTAVAIFVPGSHELNELKASNVISGFELFADEDFEQADLPKGYIGPVGLKEKLGGSVKIFADVALQNLSHWVVGANEENYHFVGAAKDIDFTIDEFASFSTAKEGDFCPECGASLKSARGIEVSQVFQLGTKYSDSLNATFMDEDGSEKSFLMGCYGVGVTRMVAAIVEQHNDESGIRWPLSVAPAEVIVVPLIVGDDVIYPAALDIAKALAAEGVEVVVDDRKERPGVKFNDAELIGWPYQVVVGKKSLEEGKVELKKRAAKNEVEELELVELDKVTSYLADLIKTERKRYL